jgi:hypothetical protein
MALDKASNAAPAESNEMPNLEFNMSLPGKELEI